MPALEDGLKPVQRRILHSMKELDDGRYNKVANIVGHTMQYHPHGDASINDSIVQIGQKDLLIDTQGNWGNIFTGDSAAAGRYIEARLTKFALETVFNPKVTSWQLSYDGRKNEPVHLPVKFPLLLAQGTEGIAVGLSTKILPHNFNELLDACIAHLKGKDFELYPDFPTGGIMDAVNYNDGKRGGRIRIRAKIRIKDKNTLVIEEIPFGCNTSSLIDSILKANERGKIKIKKIEDNTASEVEIAIALPADISPDKTIDALYAFTDCEISVSPLGCVIQDNKPLFLGVSDMLRHSVSHTVSLLKAELEIRLQELSEEWHFLSLERLFIEHKIYRDIEEQSTWEGVLQAIEKGLQPYAKHLRRAITQEDIARLTEIKIKRISKFDSDKAARDIETLENKIAEADNHLEHLTEYAIAHYAKLKKTFGTGLKRKTQIGVFETIEAAKVVIKNAKLYVNREEGFVGLGLRKDEYVCDCSDIDDIVVITKKGTMSVTKVSEKNFIDKDIIYVNIFKKKDSRTIYNLIYRDGKNGASFIKRFCIDGITRDKAYDLTQGSPDSEILYLTANPNGEAEIVSILLRESRTVKKLKLDVDFSNIPIKSRQSRGNLVSKHYIKKIELKHKGVSTLKPLDIWFDPHVKRLNTDGKGALLGGFSPEDRLLVITRKGAVKTIAPDLDAHFDEDILVLEKWTPSKPITAIHYDGERQRHFVKRFLVEAPQKEELIVSEHPKSELCLLSADWRPVVRVSYAPISKNQAPANEDIALESFVGVKGIKALGNQLSPKKITRLEALEPLPYTPPEPLPEKPSLFD